MSKVEKEGSTAGGSLVGYSAPFGAKVCKKKPKKKNNVSKPFGEPDLFENAVALSVLNDEKIEEVVKKVGKRWAVVDDKTGSTKGTYDNRKQAWERQRLLRQQNKRHSGGHHHKSHTKKAPKAKTNVSKAPKSKTATKAKKAPTAHVHKEEFLQKFRNMLNENMISYVFDQEPVSNSSLIWDNFITKLSKDTVMADGKLKGILQNVAKAEVKILGKALEEIKKTLEATQSFLVEKSGVSSDETGNVMLDFVVKIKESGAPLKFSLKIHNSKPLIVIPEDTKNVLHAFNENESKLLRAELMHLQETILDNMDDVLKATLKRDDYLKNMRLKIGKVVDVMSPLEIAMLRHLMKNTKNGVKATK